MSGPAPSRDRTRRARPSKAIVNVTVEPAAAEGVVPAPPPHLPMDLADEWTHLWMSPLAEAIAVTDLPSLRRLFQLRAAHAELLERAAREDYLADGSKDQQVVHPALKAAMSIESAITALEDRFGLTVKARQSIGIAMGDLAEAERKVAQRAAEKEQTQRADPRVADSRSSPV